jgi:uncharacterized OB-fold protein
MSAHRPRPIPDERSAGYWVAAADEALALARCPHCHRLHHPPAFVCSGCGAVEPAYEYARVSGRGTVRSWVVMWQSFLPGFDDTPFVLVDVEIDEQPDLRLIGRLIDGHDAPLAIGAPVRVAFDGVPPDVKVPAFELERRA